MNNEDIREYKIKYLFNEEQQGKNAKIRFLEEVDNLEYSLTIDKGGIYDKNLQKLGYGLKYYNILSNFYSKGQLEDMLEYMDETESRIRTNLLNFFHIDDLEQNPDIKILSSFSTDVRYTKKQLNVIKRNIPFKYFDVAKTTKKGDEDEYIIKFAFPLVGEIMNNIYSKIINSSPNLYSNITKNVLDGGAKGKFFEKIVTYHLNIDSLIKKNEEKKTITFFEDYPIEFHEEMEVLVLNDDETLEKFSGKKILKEKGNYLITQKRYNGKALDIAILKIGDINEIIGAQISIHKDGIFSLEQIDEFLKNLRDNIENYYGIKVEDSNLFFCYIFEWKSELDKKMLKACKNKGIKYFFFDVTNQIFKNEAGQIIEKLKPNITKSNISNNIKMPKNVKKEYHSLEEYFSNLKIDKSNYNIKKFEEEPKTNIIKPTLKGPVFKINEAQEKAIKIILKKDFNLIFEPKIIYTYSTDSLSKKRICDFSISQLLNEENGLGMATRKNSYYSIQSNGDFSNNLSNTVETVDCYEIS